MKLRTSRDLGQAVRARRRELHETQENIAGLSGIHRVTLAKFENTGDVNMAVALRVVHTLGMDLEVWTRGESRRF